MLDNRNQRSVRLISNRTMSFNKNRNVFVVLAIVLTTFMFTTVFSIGFSLAKNIQIMFLREQGTKSSIYLNNPTKEQIDIVSKEKYVNAAGVRINADTIETENDKVITIDYYDIIEFRENYLPAISDVKGEYPEKEDEIMLSQSALDELGIKDIKIGMNICMELSEGQKNFELSGWFQDYENFSNGAHAFISKEYIDKHNLTAQSDGLLSISSTSGKQLQLYKELENKVSLDEGQELNISFDIERENSYSKLMIFIFILIICGIIIVSGYLLIYNVMYISVTKDIRFYGLLKTIGTSPSQLKQIVKKQAFRLLFIGMPIGMLLGTAISFAAVPLALEIFTAGKEKSVLPTNVVFSPLIYLGTIIFAVVTVIISCRKPAAVASKVVPVEALKYNGIPELKKKKKKKKSAKEHDFKHGGRPYKMAWRNVFREKKRAINVFAPLFMGTMAFLAVYTFMGSIKLENFVNNYLNYDYEIFTQVNNDNEKEVVSSEDEEKLVKKISDIDGISKIYVNRKADVTLKFDRQVYKPFIENAEKSLDKKNVEDAVKYYENGEMDFSAVIIGMDAHMLEMYNKRAYQKIDIERFKKGEICLIGYLSEEADADYLLGKEITVINKNGKETNIEIGSAATDSYGLTLGSYWQSLCSPNFIYVSQELLDRLTDNAVLDSITMNCLPEAERYVTSQVKSITANNQIVGNIVIKSDMISDFKTSMTSMNIIASGISIVLILIGILNFINVMLTGVFTRRKEFAVLESVGMTRRQTDRMLMFEGVYYGAITFGLVMTVGNCIMYFVACVSKNIVDYAIFYYPWKIIILLAVIIFVVCLLVPVLVYNFVSKESVTDRLHMYD